MSNHRSEASRLADQFAALGHPHRLALFQQLCRCCAPGTACGLDTVTSVCVGDLGDGLDIAPSTRSHHLKALRTAGLVTCERDGKRILYAVPPDVLRRLAAFFTGPLEAALPGVEHV